MNIGVTNKLKIARETKIGLYLVDNLGMEVLLPKRFVPDSFEIDSYIEVFVYRDNEDRPIATTDKPLAEVGEYALMTVKSVTEYGAFLDWGLMKDLFIPFKQQAVKMEEGKSYVVTVYIDQLTQRITGSSRIEKHLEPADESVEKGQPMNAYVFDENEIGYKVILNDVYQGILYKNQTFINVELGQKLEVFVNQVRADGKIDVLVQKPGVASIDDSTEVLLQALKDNNGFIRLNDKSSPDEIINLLGMSKKQFKKAVGNLYKQRVVLLVDGGIQLKGL